MEFSKYWLKFTGIKEYQLFKMIAFAVMIKANNLGKSQSVMKTLNANKNLSFVPAIDNNHKCTYVCIL